MFHQLFATWMKLSLDWGYGGVFLALGLWAKSPAVPVGAVYLRRTGERSVEALQTLCPHAGCFVDYRPEARDFLCPCHNSTFAMDFQNATMQQNTAYQYYDPFTKQVETKYQLGLIPNISWRLEF